MSKPLPAGRDLRTVTGRLDHLGNGVQCPEILTDDGHREAVFGLAADIAPGTRLRLTGYTGIATRCLGQVLVIDTLEILTD